MRRWASDARSLGDSRASCLVNVEKNYRSWLRFVRSYYLSLLERFYVPHAVYTLEQLRSSSLLVKDTSVKRGGHLKVKWCVYYSYCEFINQQKMSSVLKTRVVHLMTPVIGTALYTITQQVLSLYQVSCKYDKQTDRREIQSTLYVRYTMAKPQVILPLWQRQSMCRDGTVRISIRQITHKTAYTGEPDMHGDGAISRPSWTFKYRRHCYSFQLRAERVVSYQSQHSLHEPSEPSQ